MKTLNLNPSQERILKLFEAVNYPIAAQDIWRELIKHEPIGLATVYRSLEALKQKGLIRVLVFQNQSLYSLVTEEGNFAICLRCGERVTLESPLPESVPTVLLPSQTFEVFYHTLEIFGICSPCQARRNAS